MGEDFLKYQAPLINFNNIDYKIQIPKVQNKGKVDLSGLLSAFGGSLLNSNNFGGAFGNIFSSAIINSGSNLISNALKGNALTEGLKSNALNSLSGSATGLASNYLGQGISSLGGDSALSRGLGAGVANGLGTVGGAALSNLFNSGKFAANFGGKGLFSSVEGAINPYTLGVNVAGSILEAAAGPSKEYGGTYGNITQTMDTIYDGLNIGANFIPGVGQGISGVMSLNKGLSNIFGSTDGMTETDAILGSAFMPAPVKWLNMVGSRTTDTFNRQSWRNQEKANSFMKNSFGDLNDKFNQARSESGKKYGLFSKGAYNRANDNIRFANKAWDTILDMANQNEYQNIRSQYMSSINNQRYAQNIDGGYSSVFRGKQGMKILNNATDHNIGMRLLSAAALIDNKAMILCSAVD